MSDAGPQNDENDRSAPSRAQPGSLAEPAVTATDSLPVPPDTVSSPLAAEGQDAADPAGALAELPTDVHQVIDALPAGSALLVTGHGTGLVQRFLLDEDKVSAGRHPRSDIFLDHATVSRSHVEFFRQGGRFVVRDAGSLNGVYVNGLRVDEAVLSSGDTVQIGRYRLTFFEGPAQ